MRAGAHTLRQTAAASSSSAGNPASPSPSAARSASLQKGTPSSLSAALAFLSDLRLCGYPARCSLPPSICAVKQRIKSVRNIGKITKAMKMVAASRLRSVQNRCEQSRGSIKLGLRSLGDLPSAPSERTTIVSLSSDRGLCGAINTNIVKHTRVLRDVCSDCALLHLALSRIHTLSLFLSHSRSSRILLFAPSSHPQWALTGPLCHWATRADHKSCAPA